MNTLNASLKCRFQRLVRGAGQATPPGDAGPELHAIRYQAFAQWPVPGDPTLARSLSDAAQRCSVFVSANALGWQVFPPFDARVTWKGGTRFLVEETDVASANVWRHVMEELHSWPSNWWCSKIPGVFQVDPGLILRTPRGMKALLTGPTNRPSLHYWTHTGLLDSDWFWVPSSINLQVWEQDRPFHLSRQTPIGQVLVLGGKAGKGHLRTVEIEDEPACLELWRAYLAEAFDHQPAGAEHATRKAPGLYRRLKQALEEP